MKKKLENSTNESNFYRPKLNGYRCSHRNRWLLLNRVLSPQAFLLFEFYLDIFDFDYKHLSFGHFTVKFDRLSNIFSCSPSSIRSWHNEIKQSGLIQETDERSIYKLVNPLRYINMGFWRGQSSLFSKVEKNQTAEIIFQQMKSELQNVEENSQPLETNNNFSLKESTSKAIASSKYPSKVQSSINELSEEDKEWIENMF